MKTIYFIVFLLILPFCINSQYIKMFTDFSDNPSWFEIEDDTNNIWEIGVPVKDFFDAPYGEFTNALVTKLEGYYPDNNISSFNITIDVSDYPPGVFCWFILSIAMTHKYDTDSLLDGCYIEISYDKGENWVNIINDTTPVIITRSIVPPTIINRFNCIVRGITKEKIIINRKRRTVSTYTIPPGRLINPPLIKSSITFAINSTLGIVSSTGVFIVGPPAAVRPIRTILPSKNVRTSLTL